MAVDHVSENQQLVNVWNSLFQPHFDYCDLVWGNCNKGISEKLQKLQNLAARILMSASYDSAPGTRVAQSLSSKTRKEIYYDE